MTSKAESINSPLPLHSPRQIEIRIKKIETHNKIISNDPSIKKSMIQCPRNRGDLFAKKCWKLQGALPRLLLDECSCCLIFHYINQLLFDVWVVLLILFWNEYQIIWWFKSTVMLYYFLPLDQSLWIFHEVRLEKYEIEWFRGVSHN